MIINSQLQYRELVGNNIQLTNHFRKRYKERVSKGLKHASDFTKNAYILGKDFDAIEDRKKRKYLQNKVRNGRTYKIYRGFIIIFDSNRAITVFPVPNIKLFNKEYTI